MNTKETYDFVCFGVLAFEFDPNEAKLSEKKIKRQLKYYKLKTYDQVKVDYIRQLKMNYSLK